MQRERVGLLPPDAVESEDLVLVAAAAADPGYEQLPDTRRSQRAHRVGAAVPEVEVTDHPHAAGVGRPHGETDPADLGCAGAVRVVAHPRTECLPQLFVATLTEEVQVHLPERRQVAVRIVDDVRGVGVADLQAVVGNGAGRQRHGEHPGRVQPGALEPFTAGEDDHAHRVRSQGPHDRPVPAGMGAEDVVRIVVRTVHQPLKLGGFDEQGGGRLRRVIRMSGVSEPCFVTYRVRMDCFVTCGVRMDCFVAPDVPMRRFVMPSVAVPVFPAPGVAVPGHGHGQARGTDAFGAGVAETIAWVALVDSTRRAVRTDHGQHAILRT